MTEKIGRKTKKKALPQEPTIGPEVGQPPALNPTFINQTNDFVDGFVLGTLVQLFSTKQPIPETTIPNRILGDVIKFAGLFGYNVTDLRPVNDRDFRGSFVIAPTEEALAQTEPPTTGE